MANSALMQVHVAIIVSIIISSLASSNDSPMLCMDVNDITLSGVPWSSEMEFAKTEGIFYVYDPIDSVTTLQEFKFPINPITVKDDTGKKMQTFPAQFHFKDDTSNVFCWENPTFSTLNIRFKLYVFYHTALKAISEVEIPDNKEVVSSIYLKLSTLQYQYKDANVSVNFTLSWNSQSVQEQILKVVPERPPIPPVQPPVDMESVMDMMTDDIVTQKHVQQASNNMEDGAPIGGQREASSDWMYIAALCSSMLGLFVLVYICVWAYRSYGRKEYEQIPSSMKSSNTKMVRQRKISLRDIEIKNDDKSMNNEQKYIMHPSAFYSFQEER